MLTSLDSVHIRVATKRTPASVHPSFMTAPQLQLHLLSAHSRTAHRKQVRVDVLAALLTDADT